mgnify:CR=1 FL=1
MFTGIVTDIGEIVALTPTVQGQLHRMRIACVYDQKTIADGASIACNGVCLDAGVCCTDSDCGSGLSCDQGGCVCIPTDTCASLGIACGPASDNCGNPLDCGAGGGY